MMVPPLYKDGWDELVVENMNGCDFSHLQKLKKLNRAVDRQAG